MEQRGWPGQAGQGLVEYGLLVLLIAMVVLAAFLLMGGQFGAVYSNIATGL